MKIFYQNPIEFTAQATLNEQGGLVLEDTEIGVLFWSDGTQLPVIAGGVVISSGRRVNTQRWFLRDETSVFETLRRTTLVFKGADLMAALPSDCSNDLNTADVTLYDAFVNVDTVELDFVSDSSALLPAPGLVLELKYRTKKLHARGH
jgi:hypothetical protein